MDTALNPKIAFSFIQSNILCLNCSVVRDFKALILAPTLRKTHAPLLQEEGQCTATVVGEEAGLEDLGVVDRSKAVTDIGPENYPSIIFDALLVETFEFSV